ncbi:MAG: LPP20 family lipoprotein [Desulfatibacillaceae bacterium]
MNGKGLNGIAMAMAVLFCMAVFWAAPGTAAAEEQWTDVVQRLGDNGKVNWSEGWLEAVGIGVPPERHYGKPQARPMALRAARLDAYRNLLEVTNGVRITSETTVRDFATESDVIRSQVEGMVKGAQVVNREYMSDGTVEVTIRMSLHGGFAQLVLPREVKQVPEVRQVEPEQPASPAPAPVPTERSPGSPPAHDGGRSYTGLVVDTRGLSARPAMAPRILDEDGREVYGSAYVSREYAVQQGMSGYSKELSAAQTNPRVTNNPATVKALRTEGPGNADLVVSNADARMIRGASENLSFLKKCRVMIVLD